MKRSLKRVRAWQEQTVKYKSVARFLKNLCLLLYSSLGIVLFIIFHISGIYMHI